MTLDEAIKRFTNNAEYERTHGNLQGCLEFRQLAEWLSELKQLRERTKWIPVSERFPEDGQSVLVDYCEENVGIMLMRFNVNGHRGFKAWMSLPERYKAEGETK